MARISAVEHLDQYVRTMLVRAFVDEKRRPWSRIGLVAQPPDSPVPGDERVEDRMVLRAALARTPRRQQAVLVLRHRRPGEHRRRGEHLRPAAEPAHR